VALLYQEWNISTQVKRATNFSCLP
jgi:hypothetical protein